jgi:hypothetical protein
MRAASKTASRVDNSDSFSFSNSVFASWRPLPMAAPWKPLWGDRLVERSANVASNTHVEDTTRFDYIYRWAVFVDTSKNGATTEWPYGRVEGIRLYIEA